jgi:hypothetical protein
MLMLVFEAQNSIPLAIGYVIIPTVKQNGFCNEHLSPASRLFRATPE